MTTPINPLSGDPMKKGHHEFMPSPQAWRERAERAESVLAKAGKALTGSKHVTYQELDEYLRQLEAERDALRAEVAKLKAERENWRASSVCRELRAQLDAAQAELAEEARLSGASREAKLRSQLDAERRLRREVLVPALRFVVEQTDHHYDPEADINDESPEDMHAHINGLLRKEADDALAQSAELDRKQEGAS